MIDRWLTVIGCVWICCCIFEHGFEVVVSNWWCLLVLLSLILIHYINMLTLGSVRLNLLLFYPLKSVCLTQLWMWVCYMTTQLCRVLDMYESMCACVRVCVCACVRVCGCAGVRVCACVRACVHACVHACVRECVCVCVHACVSLCVSVYNCECVRVCVSEHIFFV